MNRTFAGCCLAAALAMASFETPFAQRPTASFPVIVVFSDSAPLASLASSYRADGRAAANPRAWNYLDRGVAAGVQSLERRDGFRADHVFSAALRGFSARLNARQIAALEDDPDIDSIEIDGEMHAVAQTLPWGVNKIDADGSSTIAGNGSGTVAGVNVYIIDTGIAAHADLNRVAHINFADAQNTDCNGHGTHVAGTAAAIDNASDVVGVAPGAPLTGVKVLGCGGSGSTSNVIKGVDWVTANAAKPAVANMSLGGSASLALDTAILASVTGGVFYAVSAGNSGADACNKSPARAGAGGNNGVMTVAATNASDKEATWSNFGACVDVWAPGVGILSTRHTGGTRKMSGTSMSSPHVAGGGALFLSTHPGTTPAEVESALRSAAKATPYKSKDGATIRRLHVLPF